MARSQYGRGGGSNAMFALLLKELMGGGETRGEREYKQLRLEALKRGKSPSVLYQKNIDKIAGDYKTSIDLDDLGNFSSR